MRPLASGGAAFKLKTYPDFLPLARTGSISSAPGLGPNSASEEAKPLFGCVSAYATCAILMVRRESTERVLIRRDSRTEITTAAARTSSTRTRIRLRRMSIGQYRHPLFQHPKLRRN